MVVEKVKKIKKHISKAKTASAASDFLAAKNHYLDAATLALNTSNTVDNPKVANELKSLASKYVTEAKEMQTKLKIVSTQPSKAQKSKSPSSWGKGSPKPKKPIEKLTPKTNDEPEFYPLNAKVDPISIPLGLEYETMNTNIWCPGDEMNGIFTITGGSGSGKTQLLRSLVIELTNQGYPCLIIDIHGDIESGDIPVHSFDYRGLSGINPMALTSKSEIDGGPLPQVNELAQRFSDAIKNGLSPSQFGYLRSLLSFAYHMKGIKQTTISSWERDPPSFKELLQLVKGNIDHLSIQLQNDYGTMVLDATKSTRTALLNRLSPILEHPAFNSENLLSVHRFVKEPARLLLKHLNTIDMQFLAADTILNQLFAYVQSLGHSKSNSDMDKFRLFILIDETKLLAGYNGKINDTMHILNRLATEARKYGVALILASQTFAHFGDDIKANSATKIMLKPMVDEQVKKIAKELKIDAEMIANLTLPGEGYIKKTSNMDAVHIRLFDVDIRPYVEQ